MHVLYWDIETFSTLNLADCGAWRYSADLTTGVWCIAFAAGDDPVSIWVPGEPIPEVFSTAAADPDWLLVAHNSNFERALAERLLHPHYGWPVVPLAQHRCTMVAALANALPGSLGAAAAALGLPFRKDAEGRRLMLAMAKPRKARKGEPDITHWHDDMERRLRLQDYCRRDVEVERELYKRLPPLLPDEQALWQLDAAINMRGFYVDLPLAKAAREIVLAEQAAIDAEIAEITGGQITSVNQVAKLGAYIQERGHTVTGLTKRSVSALMEHEPAADIQRLLELRQQGAQAAARKLGSLISGIDADHRLRGTLRYHGASTGRWSGSRFQPQNLKKAQTKNLDAAIIAVRSGDLEGVRTIGAPLAIVGDISRNMICAAPSHVLYGADFSAVESRVLAWLAGETWKLDVYKKFDETGDPAIEPYCVSASHILKRTVTPEDEAGRAIGKVADLAYGFGGGLNAWRRFDRSDTYTDAQIETFKTEWRAQHAATVRFWQGLEGTLRRAIRTGQRIAFGNLAAEYVNGTLFLTLPSGRRLAYPQAHLEPGKYGTPEIVYKDNARGGWTDQRGWFGTFTENCVQAVARDLLAASMTRLEAAGYSVVLHCHDEAVCETPEDFGTVDEFLRLMTALPDWGAGLPLAAKAWKRINYAKPQPLVPLDTPKPVKPVVPVKTEPAKTMNGYHVSVAQPTPAIVVASKQFPPSPYAHIPLAALIGQPLTAGKILCPFHADTTPSLHVYPNNFHCFVCGAHGDATDWLMMVESKTRAEALCVLEAWEGPKVVPVQQGDPEKAQQTLAYAARIWDACRSIKGTLAIKYLADVRGIDADLLPADDNALRFHPRCPFGSGKSAPCLVALYRDIESNAPAGIHRVGLTSEVFAGGKVQRRTLGPWASPRAIKLWPATDQLFLAEGLETTLAAGTRLQYCGKPMRPAWAAGSAGNITKFPVLADVKQLTLLVDHDAAGERSANDCYLRWYAAGRRNVVRLRPKRVDADFNDVVLERRAP